MAEPMDAIDHHPRNVPAQARWLARTAIICALAAAVLLVVADVRSISVVIAAAVGLVLMLAGVWWFLSHRGTGRWLGATVAVLAPLAVVAVYAYRDVLWAVIVVAALALASLISARVAGRSRAMVPVAASTARPVAAPRPTHPYLIMNPRSGGGKVTRFDLATKAGARGAEVTLLTGPNHQDVAELARQAARRGADLLGVAGGDGTQALVAAVAADRGLPFLVLSAGTRNHFAMDLGLDRDDPAAGLDALTDGVEMRIDLGDINGRTFVNNASFGAYAQVVQSPMYRDDKRRTTLDLLPDLLSKHGGPQLVAHIDGMTIEGPTALLVSNNPYAFDDLVGLGRRTRLDGGELGVVAVTVDNALQAAQLISGTRSRGLRRLTAQEVVVDADQDHIAVGIDGESVLMPTPVRCRIRPGVLSIRLPCVRPGVRPLTPSVDPVALVRMALGRA
ncbi:MAG TPA: diacylglycerol kinase family protein [Jatrophihabitans sp.]|nr:diacylglycerol kinase family protein [Jatrophihabitans sp.]